MSEAKGNLFKEIALFEMRYQIKQPVFYVCAALFFLLTFGAVTSDSVTIGGAIGNVNRNAPFVIMQILLVMSTIGVFTTTAFVANAVHRDVEYNIQSIFFSTPISKRDYLLGRFSGALLVAFTVFVGVALAILIGGFMPWLEPERIGPIFAKPYIFSMLVLVLPNIFLSGAIFFSLATTTRSMLYTYVGVVVFFVAYGISAKLLSDMDNRFWGGLLDPFGFGAFLLTTKYWTVFEKNNSVLPLSGVLLYNRLLWVGVASMVLAATYNRFRFSAPARKAQKKQMDETASAKLEPAAMPYLRETVAQDFSRTGRFRQYFHQTRLQFFEILKSVPFIVILFLGVLNIIGNSLGMNEFYGTPVYPVTHLMLSMVEDSFLVFLFLILTFYSGELVWKERSLNLNGVSDALPVPTWVFWGSKGTALALIEFVLLACAMLTAIGIQASKGYFHFEFLLYAKRLFLDIGSQFFLMAVLALFLQVILNNKYLGFLLMLLYMVSRFVLPSLHLEHHLYSYATAPVAPYSDMNGYGHFLAPIFWFTLYWSFVALVLGVISHLFWVRGTETTPKWRTVLARRRMSTASKTVFAAGVLGTVLSGVFIFYNTNILNKYIPSDKSDRYQADYEKKYKKYENLLQPRITDVKADVDIYPYERSLQIKETCILKNKSEAPIETVHLSLNSDLTIHEIRLPGRLETADRDLGYYIYRLASPLKPGATLELGFHASLTNPGFTNDHSNTKVVANGTFFNDGDYFPHIGYTHWNELMDRSKRKKYGLPAVQRMPKIDDQVARRNQYITNDADWIRFETTVSTSSDQIAIAPGYLQREWVINGRRYFHYKMDAPILNFFSYLSARYVVKKDHWNDVAIEIYYDPSHPYNVDRMIYAIKKSLDYFTVNFGPYQHKQVRVIEFPRYETFAQSFPNTIPYSESIGFIARIEKPEDIDYVFYVTAHEVAHQWWAHQVIGANVQGATVLSETMAQYSALMVMEKEYGTDKMRKFLRYELDRYLKGRGQELVEELPLILVENQPYIHYNKGSLVMYALRDYIGEKPLNEALARFIRDKAFQEPPYTTAWEFLSYIREPVPTEYQSVLKDMFETITLYEDKATEATSTRRTDGKYAVKLSVECKKYRSNGMGEESEIPIDDWMDVGVLGSKGPDGEAKVLVMEKKKITGSKLQFEFVVNEQPTRAGIDPFNKLIDRNPEDNTTSVSLAGGGS
jgi:ABC-type transport system involved in multi-copper enzyme maturation permease subunit